MLVAERVTRGLLKGEGEKEEQGQRVKEKESRDEAREARRWEEEVAFRLKATQSEVPG